MGFLLKRNPLERDKRRRMVKTKSARQLTRLRDLSLTVQLMKLIDWYTILCGELSNRKYSLKVQSSFYQHISYLQRPTFAMEVAD